MKLKDLLIQLEKYAPKELAQDWDNVGILIGEPERVVKKVLIALDAGAMGIDYAIEHGFDLILTHHPLIFQPLRNISNPNIIKMIEHKISLISMHTNFDAAIGGVNHALAHALDLEVIDLLGDSSKKELGLLCRASSPQSLSELAASVKDKLNVPRLRLWTAGQNDEARYHRIAICGGAGGSTLPLAEQKADIFISGDLSYHSFLDSSIPIIDAGHFYTEYPALEKLAELLIPTGLKSFILPQKMHEWHNYIRYY